MTLFALLLFVAVAVITWAVCRRPSEVPPYVAMLDAYREEGTVRER